jgi:2-methylcitrate dehydratase PrpD
VDNTLEAALVEFATSFPHDAIAPSATGHVKRLLVDGIGCALAGDLADETELVAAAMGALGVGQSSVIGRPETLSPMGATMLNAYLMTAMTVCDVYRPAHCHITPLVIPPALMAAETSSATGMDFLTAVVVGMELTVRVAAGLDYPAFRARGWHSPGVVGPFGAAAAVGRLRGFDKPTMRHAFGLAATQSAGSYLSWGTPAVKFHQARGAASGVLAAELAQEGFPGGNLPLTAPDGGVYNTHSNGGKPDLARDRLGRRWELEQTAVRLWPGASPVQAMLTGIFEIMKNRMVDPANVARVMIGVSTEDFGTHARFGPPTGTFEALLSYPYLFSAALHDRQVWFEQVERPRYTDPTLLAFAEDRIEVTAIDDLPVNGCHLEVELSDGSLVTQRIEAARGTPENPADDEEIRAKFHRCADRRLGEEGATSLLEMLLDIESCPDLNLITSMMRIEG